MIYDLHHDIPHITEEGVYDAKIIRFPGMESLSFSQPDVDDHARGVPALIEYTGNLDVVRACDYPYAPSQGFLVSKRLIQTLLDISPFPYETFPTRIYSDALAPLLRDEAGYRTDYEVKHPHLYTDDFVIFKLTTYTDCLDKDRTIVNGTPFRQMGEEDIDPISETHYAFVEPSGGFPPVFITPEIYFYAWSEEAKAACEREQIRGLNFWPVK